MEPDASRVNLDGTLYRLLFLKDSLLHFFSTKPSVVFCNLPDVVNSLGTNVCNVQLQSVVYDVNVLLDGAVVRYSNCSSVMSKVVGLDLIRKCLLKPQLSCFMLYL